MTFSPFEVFATSLFAGFIFEFKIQNLFKLSKLICANFSTGTNMPITRTYKDKFLSTDKTQLVVERKVALQPSTELHEETLPNKDQKETRLNGVRTLWKKWRTVLYR